MQGLIMAKIINFFRDPVVRDESGAAMVEYVIALSFATIAAVLAMYEVGKPLMDHFFWSYSMAVQPM